MAKTPTRPFYVYRILGEMGETVYIGKGTGPRLSNQKRRFKADGEILAYFASEPAAYKYEKKQIALRRPPLNQCSGGGGGIYGRSSSGYTEEMLWECLARIILTLRRRQVYLLGSDLKPELEQFVSSMASRYGSLTFTERLAPYNIIVRNVPPESAYAPI